MGALKNLKSLDLLRQDYYCRIAIETGSGYGTGIYELSRLSFDLILSVEIDKEQAGFLSHFFRFDSRIKIANGLSVDLLKQVLPQIPKDIPILFFLDSHFPSADLGKKSFTEEQNEDIRMPLYEELKLIQSFRGTSKDVIIIDDLSLYDNTNIYEGSVALTNPDVRPRIIKDWLKEFQSLFSETHNSMVLKQEQGYLIFTPK